MTTEKVLEKAREVNREQLRWTQFNHCQAWLSNTHADEDGIWQLIKSYATIVGLVDHNDGKVYEIGKYSQTTSKQFTQICRQLYPYYAREYVEGRV